MSQTGSASVGDPLGIKEGDGITPCEEPPQCGRCFLGCAGTIARGGSYATRPANTGAVGTGWNREWGGRMSGSGGGPAPWANDA